MRELLIFLGLTIFVMNNYAFSSDAAAHRKFLDSLNPDDIENEYCATSLTEADLKYLDDRWAENEIQNNPPPKAPSLTSKELRERLLSEQLLKAPTD